MDTPKGWNRVNRTISEYKSTTDTEIMLDLLKDMAEALQMSVRGHEEPCRMYGCEEARAVLKRYQEWK